MRIFSLALLVVLLLSHCRKKDDPGPQTGPITEIDVIAISIDGVEAKNITLGDDLIVIHLPENYAGGDFIKPHVTFGTGYSSKSELVNGFSFEGKELHLPLESAYRAPRSFDIIVVPHKAVMLTEPARDYQIALGPDAVIPLPLRFSGTTTTVNNSGAIVEAPVILLRDQATGAVAHTLNLNSTYSSAGRELSLSLPAIIVPGTYTAEVVWGAKTEILSRSITVRNGKPRLRRDRWYMLPSTTEFELTGFNISKDSKYEMTIANDFITPVTVPLHVKNAGILTGTLPTGIARGNYRVTYSKDGEVIEPYDDRTGVEKYMGEDQFFLKKTTDQPLLRIISQPSKWTPFDTEWGFPLAYYPSITRISRAEPLIAYRESPGPFPNTNDLILTDAESGKEYIIPYSGNFYKIFDGFMVFLAYDIPASVPAGKYKAQMLVGALKSETYGRFIYISE